MKSSPDLARWKAGILGTTLTFALYMIVMSIGTNYYNFAEVSDNFNQLIAANTSYNTLSLEFILGHLFAPLMWLIGVATEDITKLGQLLGVKIIASEFVGYENLATLKDTAQEVHLMYDKSILMATYMLCVCQFCLHRHPSRWHRFHWPGPTQSVVFIWDESFTRWHPGLTVLSHHGRDVGGIVINPNAS